MLIIITILTFLSVAGSSYVLLDELFGGRQ